MPNGFSVKTRPMLILEHRLGRPLEDVIREAYFDRLLTQAEIGKELGVEGATVSRWMEKLGIEARFPGQRAGAA